MELFHPDGHLTDEALQNAIAQTLGELQRLEVAEHLSFCDNCLVRYTAMLTDDTLLTPQKPVAAPVLQRLRRRVLHALFNQYTTYAAAAVLALVLWGTGVFTGFLPAQAVRNNAPVPPTPPSPSFSQKANSFLREVNSALNDALQQAESKPFSNPNSTAQNAD